MLRTRDRRDVTITRVDGASGLIHGEVAMFGPCRWRADGIYADAPLGVAGPLDLVAPSVPRPAQQRHVSVTDHLGGEGRAFCCD